MLDSSARADVRIAGRGYQVDTGSDVPPWSHRTIPLLRRQFDTSVEAGESSLNPEGPWRRTVDTWYRGAGQVDQDGSDARNGQFRDSRRVDVWTKGELRPLPESEDIGGRADHMVSTPGGLYIVDEAGKTITRRNGGVETSAAITTTGFPRGVASDGESVWVPFVEGGASPGTGGVTRYTAALGSPTKIVTGDIQGLAYVGDRLIGWTAGELYDLSTLSYAGAPGALPASLMTLKAPNLGWRCATFAQGWIYLGSLSGHIYKTAVKPDGTGLDIPTIAATLPTGEAPVAIYGYLGFLIIGTFSGYRLAIPDTNGDLTLGATIEQLGVATSPAMVGRERFIYVTSTGGTGAVGSGVRRIDLSVLNDTIPAHAPDIWIDANTNIYSVGFDDDELHFGTLSDTYRVSTTLANDGWVETGDIDFGISSPKVAKGITADVGSGSVEFTIYDDEGSSFPVGIATPNIDTIAVPGDIMSRSFRVRATLSSGALLRSFTLLAFPTGVHTDEIQVPILIEERVHHRSGDLAGATQTVLGSDSLLSTNLNDELQFLRGLRDTGNFISYFEGDVEYVVQVTSVGFLHRGFSRDRKAQHGTAIVMLKTSGVLGTIVDPGVPSQVAQVLATSGDTLVVLSWDAPFDGGGAITDFTYRYSSNAGATWTEGSAGLDLVETLSGLTNGQEYLVGVRAVNTYGNGDWSPSKAVIPAGLPDAPTSLVVTG